MNERFVPLRIDGEKEPTLVQLLKITSYPTIVLASPDKRIIGNLEGFQERFRAGQIREGLEKGKNSWRLARGRRSSRSGAIVIGPPTARSGRRDTRKTGSRR